MNRAIRFLPLALLVVVIAALVWRLANPADPTVRSKLVGKPVPAFEAPPVLPGRPGVSSAALAVGKPKLVNLFASWCVPCIAEAPMLMELNKRGAAIEAIAIRDRSQDVADFLARHGDPFAGIGADPESKVQLALGSSGVPESFVVDGRGIVRFHHVGPIEPQHIPEILATLEAAR